MRIIRLNRNNIYLIGVITLFLFVIINRANFIYGSSFATGKVIKTKSWSTRRYYRSDDDYQSATNVTNSGTNFSAPIVKFTEHNYDIIFQGETNMDVSPGESVKVIYKNEDPSNARIFSFVGFLLPSLLYSLIPLLLISAAVYSFLAPADIVVINVKKLYKINFKKEKSLTNKLNEK